MVHRNMQLHSRIRDRGSRFVRGMFATVRLMLHRNICNNAGSGALIVHCE